MKNLLPLIIACFFTTALWAQSESEHLQGTITSPTSFDCEDGAIDLVIREGFGPFEVEWFAFAGQGEWESISFVEGVSGNDGTEDVTGLSGNRYRVFVSDALCGQASQRFLLTPGEDIINLIDKKNSTGCKDGKPSDENCDGILAVDVRVDGPYDVRWTGPGGFTATTETISDICGGEYVIRVTTRSGCVVEQLFSICCCEVEEDDEEFNGGITYSRGDECNPNSDTELFLATEFVESPSNTTSNDGQIRVHVNGGNGNELAIQWTGPNGFESSLEDINGLGVGTYCIEIKDGCSSDERCFELVDCSQVEINAEAVVENTCGESSNPYGNIELTVMGTYPPFTYRWSDNSRESSLENLIAGTYQVTIYDSRGCSEEYAFNIGVIPFGSYSNTAPCGTVYTCNDDIVGFQSYPGELACRYDDPFDCRTYNCYCPLTGGVSESRTVSFQGYAVDLGECALYGECPQAGDGLQFIEYGSFSIRNSVALLPNCNCFGCFEEEICTIRGNQFLLGTRINGAPSIECSPQCPNKCALVCGGQQVACLPSNVPAPTCCSSVNGLEPVFLDYAEQPFAEVKAKGTYADKISWLIQSGDLVVGDTLLIPEGAFFSTSINEYESLLDEARNIDGKLVVVQVEIPSLAALSEYTYFSSEVVDGNFTILNERIAKSFKSAGKCGNLYPNPTSLNEVYLSLCEDKNGQVVSSVRVVNMLGEVINYDNLLPINGEYRLNTSVLKAGVHFVEIIYQNGERDTLKLIKTN